MTAADPPASVVPASVVPASDVPASGVPLADGVVPPELPVRCPCLSGNAYVQCCGRLHRGEAKAATAEMLMRSRYAAFAVGDAGYLLRSWHPRTRPVDLELDPAVRWLRLDIDRTVKGGLLDTDGIVEFTAYSRLDGRRLQQHEVSRFEKIDGSWLYVDAVG